MSAEKLKAAEVDSDPLMRLDSFYALSHALVMTSAPYVTSSQQQQPKRDSTIWQHSFLSFLLRRC